MREKNRVLFRISSLAGAIPFLGGWIIFFSWLLGKYAFAKDFAILEIIGFFWLIICFFVACIGLLVLIIYVLINRHNLHVRMLFALLIILVNIPSVLIILPWQGRVERRVFIRTTNHSNTEIDLLTLVGQTFDPVEIGPLNKNESTIFSYEPTYKPFGERMYHVPDSLRLIISTKDGTKNTSNFPSFDRGECRHLEIDQNLDIK